MMDGLVKGVRWLLMVTRTVSGICLLASVAINFINIIGRYFFSVSIPWAEEIMLFLMVGCVFTGCCAVAWEGRQIRMDVVVGMLPAKVRDFLALLSELVMIATAAAVTAFRLAGDLPARGVRRAQPGGELSAGHPAGDDPDRLHLDGAPGRGAADAASKSRAATPTPRSIGRVSDDGLFRLLRAAGHPPDHRISDFPDPAGDLDRRGR